MSDGIFEFMDCQEVVDMVHDLISRVRHGTEGGDVRAQAVLLELMAAGKGRGRRFLVP
jgi:hypothetical protein